MHEANVQDMDRRLQQWRLIKYGGAFAEMWNSPEVEYKQYTPFMSRGK